jgi:hypothetical protein
VPAGATRSILSHRLRVGAVNATAALDVLGIVGNHALLDRPCAVPGAVEGALVDGSSLLPTPGVHEINQ